MGLSLRLAFAIAAGAIGSGFQHGWATGVVNTPQFVAMSWIRGCNTSLPDYTADEKANETFIEALNLPANSSVSNSYDDCKMSKSDVTYVWSLVVSIFCVGGMIGGSLVGQISSRIGR